ncbi:MAG: amidase [Pseudomonadales bacterium]|nr:amidase [Pseudomonadales bacterium]MBO6594731.1 amidase [Pseudomonadales bacterium]MBO6656536.1 amidase [Pseudomonadales bacterium]MBO6821709.1 amidase [Pseudomonadales bacterium]
MDELAFSDATTLAAKIKAKEISAAELLEHYIQRIKKYNPEVNAVVCMQLEKARVRAADADAALARGDNWGPLHGVPMTVKESFNISGLPTTWGNPENVANIANEDAVACQRLQAAGAVIFGKTNVPIHLADFQSFNEVYGVCGNPHDLERTPGGSSGGSAAALAAGFSALEMGSDIGGSIRNPAHYCGVFGLKPSWNVLPMRGHALPGVLTPSDISVIGPLARSAQDLALVMEIVGGSDELHNPGWTLELPKPEKKNFSEYKIAVWLDDDMAPVDKSVQERVMRVAQLAKDGGAEIDFDARPAFTSQDTHHTYESLLHSAMSARQPADMFEYLLDKRQKLADDDMTDEARVTRASALYYREWHAANERRTHLRWAWHNFFSQYDLLLTPMCVTSAFNHDHNPKISERTITVNNEKHPYMKQVFWAGLTGVSFLPSTVVPTGPDDQGLPIGVQIVGAEMHDLMTIEFARMVHNELGGFVPAPAYQD